MLCCGLARREPFLPGSGVLATASRHSSPLGRKASRLLLNGGSEWVPEPQPPGRELGPVRCAVAGRPCLGERGAGRPLAGAPTLRVPAQDPGGAEEWALRGRAQHPAAAAAHLQPPRAGGATAPRVVLHRGAPAVPPGLPRPQGARAGLLEGEGPPRARTLWSGLGCSDCVPTPSRGLCEGRGRATPSTRGPADLLPALCSRVLLAVRLCCCRSSPREAQVEWLQGVLPPGDLGSVS